MKIVTAIDEDFEQAFIALHNSFKKNTLLGFELICLVYGSEAFRTRIEKRGVDVIYQPDEQQLVEFVSEDHKSFGSIPGASRLLIPSLFKDEERVLFVDADSIILNSLRPFADVNMMGNTIGCSRAMAPIYKQIPGLENTHKKTLALNCGVILFDVQKAREESLMEKYVLLYREVLEEGKYNISRFGLQAIMNLYHLGKFFVFPQEWQNYGQNRTPTKDTLLVHYVGFSKPWLLTIPMKNENMRPLWWKYYELSI
ncbi:MAG TPA: hypothetical protein ENI23_15590 [bacterium]|nr:hypothetical protein [bacterium]